MSPAVLGLDIGGANLKAAWYGVGPTQAISQPFALWKDPARLPAQLGALRQTMPRADLTAITMTGELCDCFASRRQGVEAILQAVEQALPSPVRLWTTQGRFVDLASALAHPLPLASANWLALATFAARFAPADSTALVIDVGSTTTDIIGLRDGKPIRSGRTDKERLQSSELVYTGVRRTPICALITEGVMAEVFATSLDAHLVLGAIAEDAADTNTADGQPATIEAAHQRLARMFGADGETSTPEERQRLAETVVERQRWLLRQAVRQMLRRLVAPPTVAILAGEGAFLAQDVLGAVGTVSLAAELGEAVSRAACAHAVAVLAAEEQLAKPNES
jgi:probable H4MPT-linked C1 transfer pathway protein